VLYAVLLTTALFGFVSQIKKSGFTAKAATCWNDESIFYDHNWSLAWEELTEYTRPYGASNSETWQTGVYITDLQPQVAPYNDTAWGAGNTSIIRYTFEIYPIQATGGGGAINRIVDENYYCIGFFMINYNSSHCAFHLGDYSNGDRVWGVSFRLAYSNWYEFNMYGGLNRSCITYRHRAYCYDAFGEPFGGWNKSNGYSEAGAQWNGQINISNYWGSKSYAIRNQRVYVPAQFSPPPDDPLGELWLTDDRIHIMFLFLGLGAFLSPPIVIAIKRKQREGIKAETAIMLLFIEVFAMAMFLVVANYT